MRRLIGLVLLLMASVTASQATTYYAAEGGGNSCSTNPNAGGDVIYAINNCWRSPGDILDIRGGLYQTMLHGYINVNWPAGGSNLGSGAMIMRGHAGETVEFRAPPGSDPNPYVIRGAYFIFDNLIFDARNITGPGQNLRLETQHHRVQNCIIRNHAEGNAILGGGPGNQFLNNEMHHNRGYGIYYGGEDGIADGNYIHDNQGYGLHYYSGEAECAVNNDCVNRNIIRNNRIIHNGYNNVNPVGSYGMAVGRGFDNDVYNNIIADNFGGGLQMTGQATRTRIWNNTIVNNGVTENEVCMQLGASCEQTVVQNNICYGQPRDINDDTNRPVTMDHNNPNNRNPLFVDQANGDYRLQSNSPAAHDGLNLTGGGVFNTDITGGTRPSSGDWSQGAYQLGAGPGPGPEPGPVLTAAVGTYFISPSGTNTTDCAAATGSVGSPSANPFGTYNIARQCMLPGSTLYFRAGVYPALDSNSTPFSGGSSWTAPTILSGYPGETATLQATGGGPVVWLRNGTTDHFLMLTNLVLDGNNVSGTNGFAATTVNDIRVFNTEIKQTHFEAVFLNGATNIEFRDSAIHHTVLLDLVGLQNTTNVIFTRCTLHHSAANGIASTGSHNNSGLLVEKSVLNNLGKAVFLQGSSGLKLYNNLIYSNTHAVHLLTGSSGAQLYYNTAWNNTTLCLLFDTGVTTGQATNNICWASATITNNAGAGMTLTTNQITDPLFASTTPGNPEFLHLGVGSTARDTGTPIPSLTSDFDGKARPDGSGVDRGAFEAIPSAAPPVDIGLTPPFRTTFFLVPF